MDERQLRESLEALHRELQAMDSVDPGSRELLGRLMGDIRNILRHSGAGEPRHRASLKERLTESVEHFEVSHPKLTASMQGIANALADIGI